MFRYLLIALTLGTFTSCTGDLARTDKTLQTSHPAPSVSATSEPDVDANFEAEFKQGELRLKTINANHAPIMTKSMQPYSLSTEATQPATLSTAPTLTADTSSASILAETTGVEFHIFAIGQADSMLIIGPPPQRRTLLVDLGETGWNSRRNCAYVRNHIIELTGKAHLDYLLVTHFHTDHTGYPRSETRNGRIQGGGGIFCLLDSTPDFFTVDTLIDRGDGELAFKPERQKTHEAIINSVPQWISNGTLQQRVTADFADNLIELGPAVDIQVIAAAGKVFAGDPGALTTTELAAPGTYNNTAEASPNDFSIGLEITVGNFELVTAGDLSGAPGDRPYPMFTPNGHGQIYTNVESYMVNHWLTSGREADVEVYRANHHGSQNSSTLDLAEALLPEVVIYSAGGRHRHPTRMIAERFHALDADQLVTSKADEREWGSHGFPERYGNGWDNPTGDIFIFAPIGGDYYTISTQAQSFQYPIYSDTEEAELRR